MVQLNSASFRSLAFGLVSSLALVSSSPAFADEAAPGDAPAAAAVSARGAHAATPVNVSGEVSKYLVGPLGNVRGFLLKDGTAVMLHGTAGDAMAKAVPVGQSVRVEGFAPRSSGGKLVMRAAVYGQQGQIVTPPANGARHDRSERGERWAEMREEIQKLPDASANGTVETVITGHHGKPVALVLDNGTSVFLKPGLAREVSSRGIRVGDRITSSGKGASYPLGASVLVTSITFADGTHFEAPARGANAG